MMKISNSSKAANLEKLQAIGVRVPVFTILTSDVIAYIKESHEPKHKLASVLGLRSELHIETSKKTWSIRSSGNYSTPGRMSTVLNIDSEMSSMYNGFKQVVESSKSKRLSKYLDVKNIDDFEFEIIVQEMIDASTSKTDCSGVLTTIHPVTQMPGLYGNIAIGQRGDKLMSGTVNSHSLYDIPDFDMTGYLSLIKQVDIIKRHFTEPQEIEFVIKGSVAWILQTRNFSKFNLSNIVNIDDQIDIDNLMGQGTSATPFSCIGEVTYDRLNCENKILITDFTDFDDVVELVDCLGIITKIGGTLSHAALIARDFEKPCIVGTKFNNDPREGDIVILHNKGGIFKT